MKRQRPSSIKFNHLDLTKIRYKKDYSPIDGLELMIGNLHRLRDALIENDENHCIDYIHAGDLLDALSRDVRDVAVDFQREQCGGCKICEAEMKE